jgi:hypothetical protein
MLIVSWIMSCLPHVTLANDQIPAKQAPAQKFELRLEDKRLTAEFKNVPLRDIAKALETKANAFILMNDPEMADEPVTVSVHSCSLEESVKIILNGFSYALGSFAQGLTVVVLSTPPQRFRVVENLETACLSKPVDTTIPSPETNPAGPQTLDEFHSIMPDSGDCATLVTGNIDSVSSLSDEDGNQEQEGMLQRALDVLDSPDRHLYADAIEQLGMLQDERANATLIKFAQQPQQGPERYLATEALARIAVQSQFKNVNVMLVLEQLASDQDEDVRRSASLVIEQMHQVELASR